MKLKEFNNKHNHGYSRARFYRRPKEGAVRESLETFRDEKFGIMMHWGLYSTLGVIESWGLPDDARSWSASCLGKYRDLSAKEFLELYFGQISKFDPVGFEPTKMAKAAKDAGFKYLVFTTKHHDGFCMWDTQATDYKVTSPMCPYHDNKNADICKNMFDAFRDEGLKIHAYFSKSDWHSEYFWAPGFARDDYMTAFPTYNRFLHRNLWKEFREFVKKQMLELATNYGRIECLWLDGGQVRPSNGMNLKLSAIMKEARAIQPWLMVADRTVGGINENFITPEQAIPDCVIDVPWESCITLGKSFAYTEDDEYKTPATVIGMLCEVVAKGGNLALNIAPDANGEFPAPVYPILAEIGDWLKKYGYAIYGTRTVAPYIDNNFAYTKKGDIVHAIFVPDENEKPAQHQCVKVYGKVKKVTFMNNELAFVQNGDKIEFELPSDFPTELAYVFSFCLVSD